jgi:hypothetical protein
MTDRIVLQARNEFGSFRAYLCRKGKSVGRVIHLQNGSTIRTQAMRQIVWILREMMQPRIADDQRKDMAAGMLLALRAIQETIEQAASAWEKRDYWVKADHFRMDWRWVEKAEADLRKALLAEDWGACAAVAALLAQKMSAVEMPKRVPAEPPWRGAWQRWIQKEKG